MGNFPNPGIGVLVVVVPDQPISVVVVEDVVVGPDLLPHRSPVSHHAGHLEVAAHVADQHGGRVSFVAYLHHVRKVVKGG